MMPQNTTSGMLTRQLRRSCAKPCCTPPLPPTLLAVPLWTSPPQAASPHLPGSCAEAAQSPAESLALRRHFPCRLQPPPTGPLLTRHPWGGSLRTAPVPLALPSLHRHFGTGVQCSGRAAPHRPRASLQVLEWGNKAQRRKGLGERRDVKWEGSAPASLRVLKEGKQREAEERAGWAFV